MNAKRSPRLLLPTLITAAALALTGCSDLDLSAPAAGSSHAASGSSQAASGSAAPSQVAGKLTIVGGLEKLAVKGRAPKTGYERAVVFGPAWKDVDRNGCDTRNDILARDLKVSEFKPGRKRCVVLRGTLKDPYTGTSIAFVRGQGTSTAVQIDHVVALSDAWQKGAQKISQTQREALANDPLNLLAVDGPSNSSKSDGDAATWLPKNKAYRCSYVARQVAVKLKYKLWVTKGEKDAITRVAASCPKTTIPTA